MTNDIVTTNESGLTTLRGEWSPVGWEPPDDLTRDEWLAMGPKLGGVAKALHFWIGDWLNEGERKWGEMYAQAMHYTDFAYHTLTRDVWVCKSIPREIRRSELFFTHHWHVAGQDVETQIDLLNKAVEGEWSSGKMKEEVKKLTLQELPDTAANDGHQPLESLEQLGENAFQNYIDGIEPRGIEIVRAILDPSPDDDSFESNNWCSACRAEAERQHKYLLGWKAYALRLEERIKELEAAHPPLVIIDNEQPAPVDWKSEFAKI